MFGLSPYRSEREVSKIGHHAYTALAWSEQIESSPPTQLAERLRQSGFLCQRLSSPHTGWVTDDETLSNTHKGITVTVSETPKW